jgi:chromosome segregation ATPase
MKNEKEELIEVTAEKTFQYMKNGKSHTLVAGKTDEIPESEAQAAAKAGLLKAPSEDTDDSPSDDSQLQEVIDELEEELGEVKGQLDNAKIDLKSSNTALEDVKSEAEKSNSELKTVKGDLDKANAEITSVDGELDKANAEIKKLKAAAKKTADKA